MGGHPVPVGDFPDGTPYIGLDRLVLDLLGSTLIFVFIEKLFALKRDQPVCRAEWQTDFHHFIENHCLSDSSCSSPTSSCTGPSTGP